MASDPRDALERVLPSGTSVAYVDPACRAWMETVDDHVGARPFPLVAELLPWSSDAWRAELDARERRRERVKERRRDENVTRSNPDDIAERARHRSLARYLAHLGDDPRASWDHASLDDPAATFYRGDDEDEDEDDEDDDASLARVPSEAARRRRALRRGGAAATAMLLASLAPGIVPEAASAANVAAAATAISLDAGHRGARPSRGRIPIPAVLPVVAAASIPSPEGDDYAEGEDASAPPVPRSRRGLEERLLLFSPASRSRVSLRSILAHSPGALADDDARRLACYQLVSGVAAMHARGVAFGGRGMRPEDVVVHDAPGSPSACFAGLFRAAARGERRRGRRRGGGGGGGGGSGDDGGGDGSDGGDGDGDGEGGVVVSARYPRNARSGFGSAGASDLDSDRGPGWRSKDFDETSLERVTSAWRAGAVSNLDYILELNRRAGRSRGDRGFHAVVPWVIDFTRDPTEPTAADADASGWRDLGKTKWRLARGDEQLDHAYANTHPPHHVQDDCLSELAVCAYKARRLPLSVLRQTVRSTFVAEEYPGTMERLYRWSPDEAVPEFYDDPTVFVSTHGDAMGDLATPEWSAGPEDFAETQGGVGVGQSHRGTPRVDRSHLRRRAGGRRGRRGEKRARAAGGPDRAEKVRPRATVSKTASARGRTRTRAAEVPRRARSERSTSGRGTRDASRTRSHRARVLSGRARSRARTGDGRRRVARRRARRMWTRRTKTRSNASDEDARSNASDEDSDGDFTSGSFLTCSAARGDVAALGRLFAETYAPRGGRVTIDALPPSVRSATRRMLSRRPPTAAAIRDSTLFPPRIRSAAKALAAIRDAPAGIARVEAAAEALAGGEGDVEALVAPAAAEALRDALRRAGEARTGSDEDANDEASSRALGVAVGAIIARVARRAPARVSRRLLPSLISSTLTGDAFPASRALDAARRETLDPAVLRAARLVLGDAAYRAKIQPAVIACLTPTGSEASKEASKEALNPDPDVPSVSDSDPDVSSVSSAAAAALAATVADAGSLPAALRDVVRPLVAALGDGPGVIDAIARVNAVLDAPAVVRHVLPALERLVGPVDAHLPGCGARNPSEDGHSRATAAEHRGERDAVDDAVGSDDARGVDASYASSEATAVREGWSRAPSSARAFAPSAAPLASETRALAALAALEATIREVSPRVVGDRVFPRAPRPPGPLLSLLLLPTPSLPTLLAAADVVVTAAKRVGAKRAVETAARRLGPLFAFAAEDVKNEPETESSESSDDPPAALAVVRVLYPGLADACGFRALRDATPEWEAIEARLGRWYGWVPSRAALDFQPPAARMDATLATTEPTTAASPGTSFHRDGVENRTGNERYVARGFGGGERRVAGTDARRLARGAPRERLRLETRREETSRRRRSGRRLGKIQSETRLRRSD